MRICQIAAAFAKRQIVYEVVHKAMATGGVDIPAIGSAIVRIGDASKENMLRVELMIEADVELIRFDVGHAVFNEVCPCEAAQIADVGIGIKRDDLLRHGIDLR